MDYKDVQAGYTEDSWWIQGKMSLIRVLVEKVCHGKKNIKILNVGSGTGNDLAVLNTFGSVYVIDVDTSALALIKPEHCVEKKEADICALPYEENFFDVVVSFDVFEHIENDVKAVAEVYRVLKPGGSLVFTVPAFQFLFSSHDKALQHFRRYSKKQVTTLLSQFEDKNIYFWNTMLFLPMAIYRLLKKRSEPKVDYIPLPRLVNLFFTQLLKLDNFFLSRGFSLPFGLSLAGYCQKKENK